MKREVSAFAPQNSAATLSGDGLVQTGAIYCNILLADLQFGKSRFSRKLRRNRFKSRIDRNMKSMPLKNAKLGFSAAPVHRRNRLLTFSALPAVCFIWLLDGVFTG